MQRDFDKLNGKEIYGVLMDKIIDTTREIIEYMAKIDSINTADIDLTKVRIALVFSGKTLRALKQSAGEEDNE